MLKFLILTTIFMPYHFWFDVDFNVFEQFEEFNGETAIS